MENPFFKLKNNIKGDVLTDEYSLGIYATDASIYQIKPIAVILPKDAEDVKAAVSVAQKIISLFFQGAQAPVWQVKRWGSP